MRRRSVSIGTPALSPRTRIILCLSDSCEDAVEWIGGPIKYAGFASSDFWPELSGGNLGGFDGADWQHLGSDRLQFPFPVRACSCQSRHLASSSRPASSQLYRFLDPETRLSGEQVRWWLVAVVLLLGHRWRTQDRNANQKWKNEMAKALALSDHRRE